MPCFAKTGFSSASASSSAWVTVRVFAPYWLLIVTSTPGSPMMSVSPNFGSAASCTRATSRIRTTGAPLRTTTSPRSSGVNICPSDWMTTRWPGVSMKPGAAHARRGLGRLEDLGQRQVERGQPLGQHLHLELLDFAAEDIRMRHARHGEQPRLERPIDERAQVAAGERFRERARSSAGPSSRW